MGPRYLSLTTEDQTNIFSVSQITLLTFHRESGNDLHETTVKQKNYGACCCL